MDLPAEARTIDDIPQDFAPKPLGPRSEIIAHIQQILPQANFADPSWGMLAGWGFVIEFNMGREEICDGFMLHVRGGGAAMGAVAQLLEHLNLRGIDCQTSELFSVEAAEASFREWQAFRDRPVRQSGKSEM